MRITRRINICVTTERRFVVQIRLADEQTYRGQGVEQMVSAQVSARFFRHQQPDTLPFNRDGEIPILSKLKSMKHTPAYPISLKRV